MSCELCGISDDSKKARVEGVLMNVCASCAAHGEEVSVPSSSSSSGGYVRKARAGYTQPMEDEFLVVSDYGKRIRQARESKQMTQAEFAQSLNERESVMKKLESGNLPLDEKLARKLEQKLKITLIERED